MEELPKHPDVARIFTRLLESVGLNAAQFARKIGSTPQAISNYMVGRNEPGRKMLAQIIEAYPNIDAAWLATGEGEPFPNGKVLAHTRAHGEARATTHPTVQPADKELAAGTATGPTMQGIVPGEATPAQVSMVDRLIRNLEEENAKKDALIEWLQQQNQILLGKSPGNLLAAGLPYPSPVSMTPIGPRFDSEPVEAKLFEMYPKTAPVELEEAA